MKFGTYNNEKTMTTKQPKNPSPLNCKNCGRAMRLLKRRERGMSLSTCKLCDFRVWHVDTKALEYRFERCNQKYSFVEWGRTLPSGDTAIRWSFFGINVVVGVFGPNEITLAEMESRITDEEFGRLKTGLVSKGTRALVAFQHADRLPRISAFCKLALTFS